MSKLLKILLLAFWFPFHVHSQQYLDPNKEISQYNFDLWNSKDGLPINGGMAITQTKDGYIWISTFDGFKDQFGGEKGKKIMVRKLKNLLLENHQKPFNIQKAILEKSLKDWMEFYPNDKQEQVDDILVIGFKV